VISSGIGFDQPYHHLYQQRCQRQLNDIVPILTHAAGTAQAVEGTDFLAAKTLIGALCHLSDSLTAAHRRHSSAQFFYN
jgi:hypothetical protein